MATDADPQREQFLHGPLGPTVLRFGTPLALAMVLQVLFNLVDQYLIARLPSAVRDASLDALGICDMVAALATILSYGYSSATATLIAQARGRGDDDEVARLAWGSLGAVTVFGLTLGGLGALFADPIVGGVLGAKGAVRALGVGYLRVILGGVVTVFLMFQGTSIQRALGQSKRTLVAFVVGNVLNLFLAVLLVYGPGEAPAVFSWGPPIARALHLPRWEVVGAAWATVIARVIASLIPVVLLAGTLRVRARKVSFLPTREDLRRTVALAWPTSTQFSVRIAAVLLVIALVHHFYTTPTNSDAGTAYALCLRMETMALFVSMGWGSAAQTVVGTCVGAGKIPRAQAAGWWAAGFNAVTMATLAVLYRVGGEAFLTFFSANAEVVRIGVGYLGVVGPSYVLFGFAIVLSNAIVGAGASRLAMVMDLALVFAVQLPLMLIVAAALHAPKETLWLSIAGVYLLTAMGYATLWRRPSGWAPGGAA
jgi:putative MATE family efflux protein